MEPPPPSQPPPQQPPPYFYPIPMEPPPQPPQPQQPQPYFYPIPMEPPPQPPPYFYPIPIEPPPQPQQQPQQPPQPQPQPPQPQQQLQPQKKSKKQLKKQQHHSLRVRCTGCQKKSTVGPSLTEFVCSKCHLKQDVVRPPPRVTHLQVPCVSCKAIVTVPHGLPRFPCPHCNTELQAPPPPVPEEVNEVAIEVEQEEDNGGVVGETFTDYRPPKMSIGPPHPDPIVETSSLSAVQPPEPTYDLKTKNYLEAAKVLSCLQIETLVYACQRHQHHLDDGTRAGFFIGDGAGVGKGRTVAGLIWENWQHGRRKALWISVGSDLKFDARRDLDDVGATCIKVHALNKLPYSKLDSKSVGIKDGVIFLTYSSLIASSETGRSRLQQLVQWCGLKYDGLIVFDECHKAKNLVPEAGGKPTYTGKAVLELQERLPEARVIYCSATGASEPRNLGYVVRLGLWGAGTSFNDFSEFLDAMTKGGVGALELVAMDMKARGMYVCRTLSYKGSEFEVVEVPLEAKMTEIYKKAAEFWIELRVELQAEVEMVGLEKPNLFWRLYWGTHQRFFRSICMSAKIPAVVRLTKQALMENKCVVIGLQSTGEARTEDAVTKYGTELDDFISGPRELLLKFVEEKYPLPEKPESPPEEDSVKELQRKRHSANPDVSFKGRVRKAAKREPTSDDESGEESEWEPESEVESDEESESGSGFESEKSDSESVYRPARHLYTPELLKRYESAVERKSKLLDTIRSFDLPNNPLDELIDQLGGPDNVAEITGRRGMLVRASSGKGVTYQARNTKEISMEMVNMHQKQLFMDGKKLVAIISEAGSAGVSLQADRRVLNQKRRVHVTLELPWSADRAIQQFGRTHRSNQTSAPEYRLLFTNLGGERRFASVVAKRLASLGALTQGDRRAGPSLSAYNYDSLYGKHALMVMYDGILEQDSFPVVPPNCSSENPDTIQDFIEEGKAALVSIGIIKDAVLENGKVVGRFSGTISDSDMYDVGRFLNRLLGLPPESQNRLFELFISIFDHLLYKARLEGNLDPGIVDFRANTIELQGTPKTVHTDHMSGSSTVLYTFIMDRGITWEAASALLNEKQKDVSGSSASGFYESKREWLGRRHFLLAIESSPGSFKIFRAATGETLREMPITELKDKYRKTSLEKVHSKWKDECEVSSKQCMHGPKCKHGRFCTVGKKLQEVNVLGGLILPIWGTIAKALSKQERKAHRRLRVVGIETTTDNQRVVGLLVPNAAVGSVLQDLGI